MEATTVSMGKAVLDDALGYVRSKAAEEILQQLGIERDVDFITDELQMMQSFLLMADEDNGQNDVSMTWVEQIRDLACKVEDSLMDFSLHEGKKPFWGCIPCGVPDRRRITTEVKELRAKVEDVSNMNLQYRLVKDHKDSSSSKPTTAEKQSNIDSAAMFGTNEPTLASLESEVDLHEVITSEEEDLRVIAMCATSGDHGEMSAIREVSDDIKTVHASSSTQTISDLKVTSTTTAITAIVSATKKITSRPTSEMQQEDERPKNVDEEKVCNSTAVNKFNHSRTLTLVDEVLTGRETEKSTIIKLVGQPYNNEGCKVISVWGIGGMGKTTLLRSVYRSQELAVWKHAWVTVLRPFNPDVLLRDLTLQLWKNILDRKARARTARDMAEMEIQELKVELARLLKTQKCLVILDDISSTYEWDLVKGCLDNAGRIIITTREKIIAEHCSREYKNMYNLDGLKDDAALDLLTKKVFKENTAKVHFFPEMVEQARIILKKCDGLPLAISTIGGFLATKPKTAIEWRRMNDYITAEVEINPELRTINNVLMRSYNGLPYYLKSAFLYLSIFPERYKIRLDRLVRRWIAEGYSEEMHGITAEQLGHRYFDELLDRSMVLPWEDANPHNGKVKFCQLHDIIRKICISKAREENLVFTLEDGCCLRSTQGPIRHLVIGSNWKRDKDALVSVLDLSHVRSLTVFGKWRPFFMSKIENMRFLRVLDLEDTVGLIDHHLNRVGQLHHLKYLSLRGCFNIFCLPDSLGNWKHLQTLDARGTRIFELPATITKLGKLQNLRAPSCLDESANVKGEDNKFDVYFGFRRFMFLRPKVLAGGLNMRGALNLHRFNKKVIKYGAQVPRGIGQLKALHTLGGANVTLDEENAIVKELRELTELRKLGVVGISPKNSMEFWSAIAGHFHLRSLSVRWKAYSTWPNDLDGCLGDGLSPPTWLESLKLYGPLVRVTDWIHRLQNLCKLVLEFSGLVQDDAIQAIGVLPNLVVLRLKTGSFSGNHLLFQNSAFPSLVVLELNYLGLVESVLFEEDTMPRLDLLTIYGRWKHLKQISGISVLASLKEIRLDHRMKELFMSMLEERPKHVVVNII